VVVEAIACFRSKLSRWKSGLNFPTGFLTYGRVSLGRGKSGQPNQIRSTSPSIILEF